MPVARSVAIMLRRVCIEHLRQTQIFLALLDSGNVHVRSSAALQSSVQLAHERTREGSELLDKAVRNGATSGRQ